MKGGIKLSVVLLAIAIQLVFGAPGQPETDKPASNLGGSARERFQVPKLPGFEAYKKTFQKEYSAPAEDLVRQQNYLTKMIRAMISVVNYKKGNSSFYLSINPTSDFTKEEIERIKNHYTGGDLFSDAVPFFSDDIQSEFELLPGESEVEMLERVSKKFPDSYELAELRDELKMAISKQQQQQQTETKEVDSLSSSGQLSTNGFFGNPLFANNQPIVGNIRNQINNVDWTELWSREKLLDYYVKNRLHEALAEYKNRVEQSKQNDNGEDMVFVDHRQSGCMFPPRDQMLCGGCWAFSYTAIAEWLHCKTTGQLLAFSEQYLIDCGHYKDLAGCSGGHAVRAGEFVHNFGLELRQFYPFIGTDGQCPFDEHTDLKTTGYIRMNSLKSTFVPLDRWEEALEIGPMYMSMSVRGSFMEYGGGVYDSEECIPHPEHAVVVVGHGREDGREYWLIRNSHSTRWGEGGYIKLSKKSKCIFPSFGYFLGLDNGQLNPQMSVNAQHDSNKIMNYFNKIWPYAKN